MPQLYTNIAILEKGPYIRLLHLHPSRRENTDILDATLQAVRIEDLPPFEALSYVWGSNIFKRQIYLDGTAVDATENLVIALRHFRHRDRTRVL